MTRNKAQKSAARQRMARTGEPYSVARRAVSSPDALAPGAASGTGTAQQDSAGITPEERYTREAEAAGVPAAEIEARLAGFRAQEAADWAQRAAEQARELAEPAASPSRAATPAAASRPALGALEPAPPGERSARPGWDDGLRER